MSDCAMPPLPRKYSGAVYCSVPTMASARAADVPSVRPATWADAKSMIFTVPLRSIITFSGRRSWCSISLPWKACRPLAICAAMLRTLSRSGRGWSVIHWPSVWPSTNSIATYTCWRGRSLATGRSTCGLWMRRATHSSSKKRSRWSWLSRRSTDGVFSTTCCPLWSSTASHTWLRALAYSGRTTV